MSFKAEEWKEIAEVFIGSFEHVLENTKSFSPEGQAVINRFIYGFIMVNKPYMLATPDGVQSAVESVFTDELIRDFVLTLSFAFSCRWGATSERYGDLVETLAFAVSADLTSGAGGRLNAIPKPILDSLPKLGTVKSILLENKWLVILLLMQLTLQIPPVAGTTSRKR